jgi:hypothetical protein
MDVLTSGGELKAQIDVMLFINRSIVEINTYASAAQYDQWSHLFGRSFSDHCSVKV